jgi:UDP-glucose 4-epimerase
LGYYLQGLLSRQNDIEVLSLLRPESPPVREYPNITTARIDFSDLPSFKKTVRDFKPNVVIHAAASGMKDREESRWFQMTAFNLQSTLGLLEVVAALSDCQYIYLSTGLAYLPQGRPLVETDPLDSARPYGACKAAVDLLVRSGAQSLGVPLTVLRPFSFTGINDHTTRLFPTILHAAASGAPAQLTDGDQIRDFSTAEDVAAATLLALRHRGAQRPTAGVRVYNLGSGTSLSLRQLVEKVMCDLALHVELSFNPDTRGNTTPLMLTASATAALEDFGWRPRIHLAYAVWELARSRYPNLDIRQPAKWL